MSRVFALIVFLAAVAASLFLLGWVNLAVPQGKTAVIHTRTNGYLPSPVGDADGFVWRWQRLLPFNMTIYLFDDVFQTKSFNLEGALPQGDLFYRSAPAGTPPFNYQAQGSVSFKASSGALLQFMKDGSLNPDDTEAFYNAQMVKINNSLAIALAEAAEMERPSLAQNAVTADTVLNKLRGAFPDFEFDSLTFNTLSLPDFDVYQTAKNAFLSRSIAAAEAQKAVYLAAETVAAEQKRRLELLESYGEVLTKYPILVEYFSVDQTGKLMREKLQAFTPPEAPAPGQPSPQP